MRATQEAPYLPEISSPAIGLYATDNGARAIESPVRVKILMALRNREQSFHEIVSFTGKAKSTVSAHLRALLRDGIIGEKPDLADSRRKIFYIRSQYLGEITTGTRLGAETNEDLVGAFLRETDPSVFYKVMFRTIRVSLLNQGINIDPILREAGYLVGEGIYGIVGDPDLSVFLEKTARFWKDHSLGRIELENRSPVTLVVYDCFECSELPNLGRPACAFDAGILDAIFTSHFKEEQMTTELRCYAMGDDHCKFVIRPLRAVR